uniref:HECT domain-containing protein n=1 Tax=Maylandia zebra TaxID=106582 RepID=A0A3P9C8S5_9CICH
MLFITCIWCVQLITTLDISVAWGTFKDGLATLGVIHALQQHPLLSQPFMCSRPEPLTSDFLEDMFAVVLSEPENKDLSLATFYLILDTKTAVSLQDILMFATGLNSIPPAGMEPRPRLLFGDSYKQFQDDMDFGILNSPGFGLY